MEFYEKLQKLRKEQGMSQEDLANQLSVSRQAVSKWENGQGFPETDKLLLISNLFGVSLDYLLKTEAPAAEGGEEAPERGYYASREAVAGYLATKRQGARRTALGVALMIIGLAAQMILGNTRGSMVFLLFLAAGVAVLVLSTFRSKRYMELENQPLVFDPAFLKEFKGQYAQNRKRYGALLVVGILLIALGLVLSMLLRNSAYMAGLEGMRGMAIFPLLGAVGTVAIILAASANRAEFAIAENEAHMEKQLGGKRYGWIWVGLLGLATMVYFGLGFTLRAWHPGWLAFPVAAILAGMLVGWKKSR